MEISERTKQLINEANKQYFATDFSEITSIYIDLPCLKDTRLGTILALSPESLPLLIENMDSYNKRMERTFTTAFKNLPLTEQQCLTTWQDPEWSEKIFNLSPDTDFYKEFPLFFNQINERNHRAKFHGTIKITINIYPLKFNKLITVFDRILKSYFGKNFQFTFIDTDPAKIRSDRWETFQMYFLDDFARLCDTETDLKKNIFIDQNCLAKHFYVAKSLGREVKKRWRDMDIDYNDEMFLYDVFHFTEMYMTQYTNLSYISFNIETKQQPEQKE